MATISLIISIVFVLWIMAVVMGLWVALGAKILIKIIGKPMQGAEFLMLLPSLFWPLALVFMAILWPVEKLMVWMCGRANDENHSG